MAIYGFGEFELDEERRELRFRGLPQRLQPRVFDLLAYLARNSDRVVDKDELFDALWPGVIVTESSLQRAVSLARKILREGGCEDAIRTFSRNGYRFCASVGIAAGSPPTAPDTLAEARKAHGQGAWSAAAGLFARCDADVVLAPRDLEAWAESLRCMGRPQLAIPPLERAVASHAASNDTVGAARACLALAYIQIDNLQPAIAGGWHARAARYLDTAPGDAVRGLFEYIAARLALFDGRLDDALAHAGNAMRIGRETGDPDAEALGLMTRGLVLLAKGQDASGMRMQDEAAAAVLAGETTPLAGSVVYCGVLSSYRNLSDWRRARQWSEHFQRWCARNGVGRFTGICGLHRAEVLSVGGALDDAEEELRHATELLSEHEPWAAGEAFRVYGDVRLGRGDLDEAETAYRRAY